MLFAWLDKIPNKKVSGWIILLAGMIWLFYNTFWFLLVFAAVGKDCYPPECGFFNDLDVTIMLLTFPFSTIFSFGLVAAYFLTRQIPILVNRNKILFSFIWILTTINALLWTFYIPNLDRLPQFVFLRQMD